MPSHHKHLRDTLNSKFIVPIVLGIFLSIIFTCACLVILTARTMKQKRNRELVEGLQSFESKPLLLSSEIVIVENYQLIINALAKIEAYANFLNETTSIGAVANPASKQQMKQFIERYAFNVVEMRSIRREEAESLVRDRTNCDYATWLINERVTSIQHVASDWNLLKLMYLFANLNPLFNSLYETLNVKEQRVTRIYAAVPDQKLLYKYPMYFDSADEVDFSGSWCVTENYSLPYYFYFQCKPWYIESIRMKQSHDDIPISISEPHLVNGNTYEVTLCLSSSLSIDMATGRKLDVLYCIDTLDTALNRKLNAFSNMLSGYLFLLRIESKLPLYYLSTFDRELKEYDLLEFPLNMQYSLDEVLLYNNITFKDFVSYNKAGIPRGGGYVKNGVIWQYGVIPIFLNYESQAGSNSMHLLNLIYIENTQAYINLLEGLLSYDVDTLFSSILIYVMQGLVLVLISRYLVNAIASSIVLPMKNIKKTLEKLNLKRHLIERKKHANKEECSDKEQTEEEEDNEDDEEYITVRSQDIQALFVRIIELKDSLATLNLRSGAVSARSLTNYLFATEVFKQRKKTNAYLTCNSNVGNLLINCNKYDIAIMHLIESESSDLATNKAFHQVKLKIEDDDNAALSQKEDKSAQENIKNLLESRYPKLIYCFKKFFSNIKKFHKEEGKNEEHKAEMETYSSNAMHHIQLYESTLKKYQELARSSNQTIRLIYANLEFIEYYIKYEIKHKRNVAALVALKALIEETEVKIKEKKHSLKPKRVYKDLLDSTTAVDSIEISKDILFQRLYYLQAYLAISCKHYGVAIDYLFKVTEAKNTISDARTVVQSFKKLVKIAKMYRREYSHTNVSLEGNLLDKLISIKEKEISKFVSEEKDFLIVINSYTNGNSTFIKAAFDKARLIYEYFVCAKDRFGIMLFGNDNINLITKLEFIKDTEQSGSFLKLLEHYGRDDEFSEKSQTIQEEDMESLLVKAKAYVSKKNLFGTSRRLFIILFSHSIAKKSLDYLNSTKPNPILKPKLDSLILVVQSTTDIATLSNKKSNQYDIQKIDTIIPNLKATLRVYGSIQEDSFFSMEKASNVNSIN